MRFLVDNNLSPRLTQSLLQLGHDGIHVSELGLGAAADSEILAKALASGAILITADSDFPEMLALSGAAGPSVIYLTGTYPTEPEPLAVLIHNQLSSIEELLFAGAVIALDAVRMRVRSLPIGVSPD